MKRKIKTLVALCAFALSVAAMDSLMENAIRHGAMAKIRYRVIDDEGAPVSNVVAHVWFSSYARHQDDAEWFVTTDTNGMFTVEHRTNESLDCGFDKEGYYHSSDKILFRERKDVLAKVKDGKWQPYGETRTVVLKRIKNPHEMLGPDCPPQRKVKIYDKWLGFDLEKGDFLPPMGVGAESDMLVRFRLNGRMPHDWSIMMDVSFTNNPYAGACRLKKDGWSDMKSSYYADTNAVYQTDFTFKYCHEKGVYPYSDKLNQDEYMIFRIRTKVDRDGKLVSARYGKLYGPWNFEDAGGSQIYKVFLNAKDNDANLEDMWTIETARKYRRED